jgi:hypothetical protein
MRPLLQTGITGLLCCTVAGCFWQSGGGTVSQVSFSSFAAPEAVSSAAAQEVTLDGMLVPAGVSIYMEGTHRLDSSSGEMFLLESDVVALDDYTGKIVRVTGEMRPTVEAGGMIVHVRSVEVLSVPEASSSSVAAVSSAPEVSSAVASSIPPPPKPASSAPRKASSSAASASSAIVPASSAASSSVRVSASSSPADMEKQRRVQLMTKAKVDPTTFTQLYCSRQVGFCAPLYKSWYYFAFGTTSSNLWHVEVGPEQVEKLGDGPLIINLVSGALDGPDETIQQQGDYVVGYRSWTNNRHFEISAPVSLQAAVQYIVSNISVYHVDEGISSASPAVSSSSSSRKALSSSSGL